MMRLQKFMAQAGVASRRASEVLITDGKVKVNGHTITELGYQVNEKKDVIHVRGQKISITTEKIYYMLNKPRGYLSTTSDERGRKTVLDLVPDKERLYPVGRLDLNTSGIIILTNDGELTYGLTHPKHQVPKTYVVKVSPIPTKEQLAQLRKGGDIGPYSIGPCDIQIRATEEDNVTYAVTINEGKNHQVRNMFEFFDCEIITLKRIAIGTLTLKGLRLGKSRELETDEIEYLYSIAVADENAETTRAVAASNKKIPNKQKSSNSKVRALSKTKPVAKSKFDKKSPSKSKHNDSEKTKYADKNKSGSESKYADKNKSGSASKYSDKTKSGSESKYADKTKSSSTPRYKSKSKSEDNSYNRSAGKSSYKPKSKTSGNSKSSSKNRNSRNSK